MRETTTLHSPIPGFTTDTTPDDRIALSVFGPPGSGKTRFSVSAPGPIGFIPLDRKSRKTVDMVKAELGAEVYMPKRDLVTPINPMKLAMMASECTNKTLLIDTKKPCPMCCAKHYHRWQVNLIKEAVYQLHDHPDIQTIVIDSGTAFYEDLMFATFGRAERIMQRDRGPINREMRDFYASLASKHLIVIHEAREIYKNDKGTGKFEASGWNKTGYNVNAEVELGIDDTKAEGDSRFFMNVKRCQSNPGIQGPSGLGLLTDDQITFPYLAMAIYPDSELEEWTTEGAEEKKTVAKATERLAGK